MNRRVSRLALVAVLSAGISIGCRRGGDSRLQGYVEGEFVYVASPLAGTIEELAVQRGAQVKEGDRLFGLDDVRERAARDEAEKQLERGRAELEDAKKGKRPPEIESLEQQLKQARASLDLSGKTFNRQKELFGSGATPANEFDAAQSRLAQDRHKVEQLEADLKTAALGSRDDQIAAAAANVRALEATLAKATWDLEQKRQSAPQAGVIYDTLYRTGEWVAAGKPIISLLPPANIKVRTFVPEKQVGSIQTGREVRVFVDGVKEPFTGKVSFISPKAEYTPPVIFSQQSREKLVFMVEAVFEPAVAERLHPGQPVDVEL